MTNRLFIFDLDGTMLCSKHRQATKEDGTLDLAHWRQNNTPEKILMDSLMPLAALWQALTPQHGIVAVCTARVLGEADFTLLHFHGLWFDYCLSRDGDNDTRPDAQLKREKLLPLIAELRPRHVVMLDDAPSVLAMAATIGIEAYDAKQANQFFKLLGSI